MTKKETRAWVLVYHPNMSRRAQEMLITKLSSTGNRDIHTMALEASLLNFQNSIDQLTKIDVAVARMRRKTLKKMKKKVTPRSRAKAKAGKNAREAHWNEHATPIMETMEIRLVTLQSQLQETSKFFTDLAEDGYAQMMVIMEKRVPIKTTPERVSRHPIIETCRALTIKLYELLRKGEDILPGIQKEIDGLRTQLSNSISAATT